MSFVTFFCTWWYLNVAEVINGKVETEIKAVSTSAASDENNFRYNASDKQYMFNLSTKNLKPGTYQLRIDLGDGSKNIVKIVLK
jgi:tRNA U38,U39,U40 pseudouridine synthase TruA